MIPATVCNVSIWSFPKQNCFNVWTNHTTDRSQPWDIWVWHSEVWQVRTTESASPDKGDHHENTHLIVSGTNELLYRQNTVLTDQAGVSVQVWQNWRFVWNDTARWFQYQWFTKLLACYWMTKCLILALNFLRTRSTVFHKLNYFYWPQKPQTDSYPRCLVCHLDWGK